MQVKLVIKRSRVLSDGRHNIFFSIREPGKTPRLRKTGQRVFANRWDEDKGMIDPNTPNAQLINNELRRQIDALEKIILDARRDQRILSAEQVYDLYEGKSETTGFVSFARQKLDTLKPHLALKTYKDYGFGIDKVEQYQPHVTFEQINKAWLQAYQLKQQRAGRKQNGIYHDFATLRRFFTLAQEENLTKNNPFRGFKFRQEETVRAFLMPDELARVDELYHDGIDQLPFPAWKTLGFYLFSCYTGLSHDDMLNRLAFSWQEDKLIYRRGKTRRKGKLITIPLSSKAKRLLFHVQTYQVKQSNTRVGKDMACVAEVLGIEKKLTYHTARHTFAINSLMRGINIKVIQKILGHSSVQTTEVYLRIVDEYLEQEMQKWED